MGVNFTNASTDRIRFGTAITPTTTWSFYTWFRRASTTLGEFMSLDGATGGGKIGVWWDFSNADRLQVDRYTTGGVAACRDYVTQANLGITLSASKPFFVAVTQNGNASPTVYTASPTDGVALATRTTTNAVSGGTPDTSTSCTMTWGNWRDNDYALPGDMEWAGFHNVVLTAGEIEEAMWRGMTMRGLVLASWMEDASHLYDLSGNANAMTGTGLVDAAVQAPVIPWWWRLEDVPTITTVQKSASDSASSADANGGIALTGTVDSGAAADANGGIRLTGTADSGSGSEGTSGILIPTLDGWSLAEGTSVPGAAVAGADAAAAAESSPPVVGDPFLDPLNYTAGAVSTVGGPRWGASRWGDPDLYFDGAGLGYTNLSDGSWAGLSSTADHGPGDLTAVFPTVPVGSGTIDLYQLQRAADLTMVLATLDTATATVQLVETDAPGTGGSVLGTASSLTLADGDAYTLRVRGPHVAYLINGVVVATGTHGLARTQGFLGMELNDSSARVTSLQWIPRGEYLEAAATTTDSGSAADSSSPAAAVGGSDSGSAGDANAGIALSGTVDAGTTTDAASALTADVSAADAPTLADATAALTAVLAATDAGTLADAGSLVAALSASDTGGVAEAAAIAAALTAADALSLADASSIAAALTGTDAGSAADATSTLTADVSASDSGTGGDSGSVGTETDKAGTDAATLTEAAAVSALLSAADALTFSEAALLDAALAGTDTGSGADVTAALSAALAAVDAGSAAELAALAAAIIATDAAALATASAVAAALQAQDDAAAMEAAVALAAVLTAVDTATLAEDPGDVLVVIGGADVKLRVLVSAVAWTPLAEARLSSALQSAGLSVVVHRGAAAGDLHGAAAPTTLNPAPTDAEG